MILPLLSVLYCPQNKKVNEEVETAQLLSDFSNFAEDCVNSLISMWGEKVDTVDRIEIVNLVGFVDIIFYHLTMHFRLSTMPFLVNSQRASKESAFKRHGKLMNA